MKLREDWKYILKYAWSIRINLLSTLFGLCEIALPIIDQMIYIPRGTFLVLALLSNVGSSIARVLTQKEFQDGTE